MIRIPHPAPETIPRWTAFRYPTFQQDRQGENPAVVWISEPLRIMLFSGQEIIIPAGFPTDGASVPRALQSVFSSIGDHFLADIIHDYLYTTNLLPRAECDLEFWRWMDLLRPLPKSRLDNWLRYQAVRLGGANHYHHP
jgi:hypothetical protein